MCVACVCACVRVHAHMCVNVGWNGFISCCGLNICIMYVCKTVCVFVGSFHFRFSKSEKSIEFTSDTFTPYLSCAASLLTEHSTLISLGSGETERKKRRETGSVAHSSQLTLIKTHVYDGWIFSTWAVPLARLKDLYDSPGHCCAFLRNQQKF